MSDTVKGIDGNIQSLKREIGEAIAAVNETSNELKADVDAKIKKMIRTVDTLVANACAWSVLLCACAHVHAFEFGVSAARPQVRSCGTVNRTMCASSSVASHQRWRTEACSQVNFVHVIN
jgi:hypothetical protein